MSARRRKSLSHHAPAAPVRQLHQRPAVPTRPVHRNDNGEIGRKPDTTLVITRHLIEIYDPAVGRVGRVHGKCQQPINLLVRPGLAKRHTIGIRLSARNREINNSHRCTSLRPLQGRDKYQVRTRAIYANRPPVNQRSKTTLRLSKGGHSTTSVSLLPGSCALSTA